MIAFFKWLIYLAKGSYYILGVPSAEANVAIYKVRKRLVKERRCPTCHSVFWTSGGDKYCAKFKCFKLREV